MRVIPRKSFVRRSCVASVAALALVVGGCSSDSTKTGRDYLCEDLRALVTDAQAGSDITGYQGRLSDDSKILRGEGNDAEADAAADFARAVSVGRLPDLSELPDGYCKGS